MGSAAVLAFPSGEIDEPGDGLGKFVGRDVGTVAVGVEVDLGEEGLIQHLAGTLAGVPVQLVGVGEQVEQVGQGLGGCVDVRGSGVVELPGEPRALVADRPQPGGDLVLRPVCVADEVEEAIFLCAELCQLSGHLRAQRGALVGRAEKRLVDTVGDLIAEFTRQRDRRVVVQYSRLDPLDREVGQVAGVPHAALAEVVEVQGSGLALPSHDHEPSGAAAAPDEALEVVMVGALAGAVAVSVEHDLYAVEEFRRDEGFVPPLVLLAAMRDVSQVVPVTEQLADLVV